MNFVIDNSVVMGAIVAGFKILVQSRTNLSDSV